MSEAGQYENMKAMEEAVFKNVRTVLHDNRALRAEVNDLRSRLDTLHGHLSNQSREMGELRRQLALLQQEFYKKGTTSYSDSDGRELADKSD